MIEVWAPDVARVEIEFGAPGESPAREPMARDDRGWWRWEGDPTAYPVLDYAFVLDGESPALPDPRSAWQPHGVDGPSRWFDVAAHQWADATWRGPRDGAGTLGGVVYECHIGTFTDEGTFDAAIARLDYLVDLGVDVVEILPVAAIPGRWGWGYDGVDLYAVHDALGGPLAFQRFVDACHARGLGVCLDVVYNHLGPSGNYLGRFGPYFTQTHTTPWGPAVNLDAPGSDEVRAFIIDNALRWFRDFHVDALRLDAVHALVDEGERHLLAELSDSVAALADSLGRPLDLIAESDLNDTAMVTTTAEGGLGMTAQWADDVHHGLHVALTGETQGYYEDFGGGTRSLPDGGPLDVLAHVLTRGFLHDGRWSTFRGRAWGKPIDVDSLDGRRLVTYLQTHDQVGNRATGDRISATLSPGRQAIGAALYLLGPGTPMVFMGEEFATSAPWQFFTDFTDEAMAEAVRAGRRAEFGAHGWTADEIPDPQSRATRDASVLRWDELSSEPHASLLRWYTDLIALRRSVIGTDTTRFADVTCHVEDDGKTFVMSHRGMTVSADLGRDAVTVSAPGIPDLVFP
ncbi:malto-oligosyltrehalose trehalohydrolase [Knoellia subterranea]|uniref:Malto-oligosyltrehalose trehalohydrolase n=1 Tax=Knoellia subterranea KCTC 19937 TaxID=1385521 RepID=A0A0A0JR28_9MICO|nr:malto-oligosyltrehalose trehalohydrolase [Knoellia subterranea]KGN39194.1 malto-oligosyltrehalose trehalohydrolase [Knoellia subterranea KCTC 19937]